MTDTADLHISTGAYAMDALPAGEREIFEQHLAVCDACDLEVAELVATAARLGAAESVAPPVRLRAAVLGQLDDVRQEAPRATGDGDPSADVVTDAPLPANVVDLHRAAVRRRWVTNLVAPAAAVVAIAVLGLSAIVANLNGRIDQMETGSTQVAQIMAASDAEVIDVPESGADMARLVAAPSRGEAVFMVDGMAAPGDGLQYVLWLIHDGVAAPAGAFDVDEAGAASRVLTGDLATADAVGVTVEPADVTPTEPTSDPLMAIEL